MIKRIFLINAVLVCLIPLLGVCKQHRKENIHDILYTLEKDMDHIRSFSGDFIQKNPDGTVFRGKVFLKRPGNIKFEYDTPPGMIIVSDGKNLIYFNPSTHQVSYIPLENSPAKLLLDDQLDLRAHASVVSFQQKSHEAIVTLKTYRTKQQVILFIDLKDKTLKGWITKDPQEQVELTFFNIIKNPSFPDPSLFTFKKPKRSKKMPS